MIITLTITALVGTLAIFAITLWEERYHTGNCIERKVEDFCIEITIPEYKPSILKRTARATIKDMSIEDNSIANHFLNSIYLKGRPTQPKKEANTPSWRTSIEDRINAISGLYNGTCGLDN